MEIITLCQPSLADQLRCAQRELSTRMCTDCGQHPTMYDGWWSCRCAYGCGSAPEDSVSLPRTWQAPTPTLDHVRVDSVLTPLTWSPLRWKPLVPGWYFYRWPRERPGHASGVVWVDAKEIAAGMQRSCQQNIRWAGPIPEPTEQEQHRAADTAPLASTLRERDTWTHYNALVYASSLLPCGVRWEDAGQYTIVAEKVTCPGCQASWVMTGRGTP